MSESITEENMGFASPVATPVSPSPEPEPESYMDLTDDVRELLKENQRRERHA